VGEKSRQPKGASRWRLGGQLPEVGVLEEDRESWRRSWQLTRAVGQGQMPRRDIFQNNLYCFNLVNFNR
jgi:hypothetical protein